ncbi:peroxidase family protein, partial [Vibrio parahaemolyticus V-223/04]
CWKASRKIREPASLM